jgi:hypothetical protein
MWTVIIVIVVVIIIISLVSSQQENKSVQSHHISKGGLRKSFPILTNHLENFYDMEFVTDTGRMFCFAKKLKDTNNNTGTLEIGIKYNIGNQLLIFSKYRNSFHTEFHGVDVAGVDFNSIESIDRCINISLDKIKSQGILKYENAESKITNHPEQTEFISKWVELNSALSETDLSERFDSFVNLFFVPDSIVPEKFMANLDILRNSWKGLEEGYGTESAKDIRYIPPAFDIFFIAGYPDVYKWCQANAKANRVEAYNKLAKLREEEAEDAFSDPDVMAQFYRGLINQYKREGNKLECV